ncbi:hypothetical protein RB3426 [Rhodopirellula baltica SH 1]|uniref:Uncharacterized protein n=1 Tax=Rhodopirellula baltica (strain DSM 10527 / NCIMB 13988 / SH1) TaxID=243090 RepID=Q7UU95_RHOBA|nr:hypothetical protein RB3426 [Rhodopirellula baltica SH 1]
MFGVVTGFGRRNLPRTQRCRFLNGVSRDSRISRDRGNSDIWSRLNFRDATVTHGVLRMASSKPSSSCVSRSS